MAGFELNPDEHKSNPLSNYFLKYGKRLLPESVATIYFRFSIEWAIMFSSTSWSCNWPLTSNVWSNQMIKGIKMGDGIEKKSYSVDDICKYQLMRHIPLYIQACNKAPQRTSPWGFRLYHGYFCMLVLVLKTKNKRPELNKGAVDLNRFDQNKICGKNFSAYLEDKSTS